MQDDIQVEVIWPEEYVEASLQTMSKYAGAIAHMCKAAALLEEDETEFLIFGINVLQTLSIETIFETYGVLLTHEHGKLADGTRWTYFYADVTGLQKKLREGGNIE